VKPFLDRKFSLFLRNKDLYLDVNKRNILTQMQIDIKRKRENKSIVPIAKDTSRDTILYHNLSIIF